MSFEKTRWLWHNGKLVLWNGAQIHASAFGLHYGTGVFEGIRAYQTEEGPAIFRLKEHLDRFDASARAYGIEIGYSPEELSEAISETVILNDFQNCYIRPIAYYDSGSLGIRSTCPVSVTIISWEWPNALDAEKKARGLRVTISPWRKFHHSMMPTTAKSTGQYLNSILAVRDAAARGFDEALLLDMDGNLAEGAVENIFLVRNGQLLTNDERSSILLGVTRASVIEIARHLGYEVEIRTLTLDDLWSADEAFLTGTAVEIAPIREVDGRSIGDGRTRPVTDRIQAIFSGIVSGGGRSSEESTLQPYRHWLYPVETLVGAAA
ncbi:MAG TPA: branched-chain amino acid transaminase [Blastocatellia bacterium]|nr:branched-chain amino acid transaminase [Blastocatellia bacterium]